jgi:hypothetical protein
MTETTVGRDFALEQFHSIIRLGFLFSSEEREETGKGTQSSVSIPRLHSAMKFSRFLTSRVISPTRVIDALESLITKLFAENRRGEVE